MYASDLTNKKRAQVVYSDISKQKALLASGSISRINYQKGGNDYAYMIELEKGCINNTCFTGPNYNLITRYGGNGVTTMDISNTTYIDPSLLIEYGYPIYIDSSGNSISNDTDSSGTWSIRNPANTLIASGLLSLPAYSYYNADDMSIPIPMGSMEFNFFNQTYNASRPMYWSTNGAITFYDPQAKVISIGSVDSSGAPFARSYFPAILLGNYDRRLDKLHISYSSSNTSYLVISLYVFYGNLINDRLAIPNTGQYQIRIIKELYGQMRQWIEVRTAVSPVNSGYISSQLTTDTNPAGGNVYADPTKLSPYNITDGTRFYNPCGTTFATVAPTAGTSFVFQSDSNGSNWIFANDASIPV